MECSGLTCTLYPLEGSFTVSDLLCACDLCHPIGKIHKVVYIYIVDALFSAVCSNWCFIADAKLLPLIRVTPDGATDVSVSTSVCIHDVTGGIQTKLTSAIDIVAGSGGSIPVFICAIDSRACKNACLHGDLKSEPGTLFKML